MPRCHFHCSIPTWACALNAVEVVHSLLMIVMVTTSTFIAPLLQHDPWQPKLHYSIGCTKGVVHPTSQPKSTSHMRWGLTPSSLASHESLNCFGRSPMHYASHQSMQPCLCHPGIQDLAFRQIAFHLLASSSSSTALDLILDLTANLMLTATLNLLANMCSRNHISR